MKDDKIYIDHCHLISIGYFKFSNPPCVHGFYYLC